jgi:hypothetical protein
MVLTSQSIIILFSPFWSNGSVGNCHISGCGGERDSATLELRTRRHLCHCSWGTAIQHHDWEVLEGGREYVYSTTFTLGRSAGSVSLNSIVYIFTLSGSMMVFFHPTISSSNLPRFLHFPSIPNSPISSFESQVQYEAYHFPHCGGFSCKQCHCTSRA